MGEAMIEKLGQMPDACWLFCAPGKGLESLVKGVYEAIDRRPLIGCTTDGEISTKGFSTNSAVLGAIASDQIDFEIVAVHEIGRDNEKAGRALARKVEE